MIFTHYRKTINDAPIAKKLSPMDNSQKTTAADGPTLKPTAARVPIGITDDGQLIVASLRDWFAGQALAGAAASLNGNEEWPADAMAIYAYKRADAMLVEAAKLDRTL